MNRWLFSVLILGLLPACYQAPQLNGFDTESWQKSPICSDLRLDLAKELISQQDVLLGSTQNEIELLLGKAPINQLGDRNEKYFRYPVSRECGEDRSLQLRFNALGLLKEVTLSLD